MTADVFPNQEKGCQNLDLSEFEGLNNGKMRNESMKRAPEVCCDLERRKVATIIAALNVDTHEVYLNVRGDLDRRLTSFSLSSSSL